MSQPFRVFGLMMMVYPESQGLQGGDEDDGDDYNSEGSGNSCHSEPPSPLCKSSENTDENQTEDLEEPTFFLTPGHSYMVKDKQVGFTKHALETEEEDQEFQEPIYKDVGVSDSLAGDEEPSLTYHLPGHERFPALQKASTAPSGFHDSFQHSSGQHLGTEATATQAHASDHYVGHPESTMGTEPHVLCEEDGKDSEDSEDNKDSEDSEDGEDGEDGKDSKDRESLSLQPTYNLLWHENSVLRSENEVLRNANAALASENFTLRQALKELKKDRAMLMGGDVVLREEYGVLREQYDRLESENAALRKDHDMAMRMFDTFQNNLRRQACVVVSLQDQLKTSQAEREREAQELQSLVQETECHLKLTTQRALNAETNVERLKQKILILQGQLERYKLENENLRTDWPGSSEAQLRLQQAKLPRAHNGQRCLPQVVLASEMLPVVTEVLESTRKILRF